MRFDLYASRTYPDLALPEHWAFISYEREFSDMAQQRWLLEIAGNRNVACELSDITGHMVAARSGVGVAGLPCFLGDADPMLVKLEHDGVSFLCDLWLVTHRDMKRSPIVRTVMDYFTESFASTMELRP